MGVLFFFFETDMGVLYRVLQSDLYDPTIDADRVGTTTCSIVTLNIKDTCAMTYVLSCRDMYVWMKETMMQTAYQRHIFNDKKIKLMWTMPIKCTLVACLVKMLSLETAHIFILCAISIV